MKNYDCYSLIGNCTTAALVSNDCSIDWLCLPFFDSPSIFGRILDEEKGGYFKITGVDTVKTYQSYIPHTAIVKTTFETKQGVFEVQGLYASFPLWLWGELLSSGDPSLISGLSRVTRRS